MKVLVNIEYKSKTDYWFESSVKNEIFKIDNKHEDDLVFNFIKDIIMNRDNLRVDDKASDVIVIPKNTGILFIIKCTDLTERGEERLFAYVKIYNLY